MKIKYFTDPVSKLIYHAHEVYNLCTANKLNIVIFKQLELTYPLPPWTIRINSSKYTMADTRYPIIVYKVDDKLFIYDGAHRIAKLKETGQTATVGFILSPKDFEQLDKTKGYTTEEIWKYQQ